MKNTLKAVVFLLVPLAAQAGLFDAAPKEVGIQIAHAPEFGLTVKRVAFGNPGGACAAEAAELLDRMILPAFQQNGVSVIEREALDQIMREHSFNQSAYADPTSAARLGKILGPSALVLVSVNGCSHDQQPLYSDEKNFNGAVVRTFISKTRFSLEGSIRVVDLTTGQILGSHNFESKPESQNTSTDGQPEYPPVDVVKDSAMHDAEKQIRQMFFPWSDIAGVPFFDDKDCGLKQIYDVHRSGDDSSALTMADKAVEECKSDHKKDKTLPRAYYDAGFLHCIQKDYDKAKELFAQAMQGKGVPAAARASTYCEQARQGAAQVKDYEARRARIPEPSPVAPPGQTASSEATSTPRAQQPERSTQVEEKTGAPSVEERLKNLDGLYKKGLITKKEYDQRRAEILKSI